MMTFIKKGNILHLIEEKNVENKKNAEVIEMIIVIERT